jgi:alkylation response protein AidB-like acyl-CoA dehydrogenase
MSGGADDVADGRQEVGRRVAVLLADHPPTSTPAADFLGAQFDSGLADVSYPVGHGGLDLPAQLQSAVVGALYDAGAPSAYFRNPIGVGHAAPTIVAYGSEYQLGRFLRPMFCAAEIWCQLFSEPGAGSDLAGLSTRASRTTAGWIVSGQKVWTSLAHVSQWAMLLARTDPGVPKHKGLTYFIVDMTAPGVTIRPLRQLTGDAEFNEVFLDDVRIPDEHRLGPVGEGWRVAVTTLMNERIVMGRTTPPRGSGLIAEAMRLWRASPAARDPAARDLLVSLWMRTEAQRLTSLRAQRTQSAAGPEGSIAKLNSTEINMAIYDLIFELLGPEAALFDSYDRARPDRPSAGSSGGGLDAGGTFAETYEKTGGPRPRLTTSELRYGYLRSRANGIEAGSSQIMRTILAERVLGLPREVRGDVQVPWRDVPRDAPRRGSGAGE